MLVDGSSGSGLRRLRLVHTAPHATGDGQAICVASPMQMAGDSASGPEPARLNRGTSSWLAIVSNETLH